MSVLRLRSELAEGMVSLSNHFAELIAGGIVSDIAVFIKTIPGLRALFWG
jgi:hypothetical protein